METGNRHLFVVAADGGTPRQLTKGNWSVGSRFDALDGAVGWDWTPDSRTIVFDGLADSTADLNYRSSNIYAIDVAQRHDAAPNEPGRRMERASRLAGRPQDRVSRLHAGEGQLPHVRAVRHERRRLGCAEDQAVTSIATSATSPGRRTAAGSTSPRRTTARRISITPALAGIASKVTNGEQMLTSFAMAPKGGPAVLGVALRSTAKQPNDVVRIALKSGSRTGDVTQLTHVNDDLLARIKLGDVERIVYTSTNGTRRSTAGW